MNAGEGAMDAMDAVGGVAWDGAVRARGVGVGRWCDAMMTRETTE